MRSLMSYKFWLKNIIYIILHLGSTLRVLCVLFEEGPFPSWELYQVELHIHGCTSCLFISFTSGLATVASF